MHSPRMYRQALAGPTTGRRLAHWRVLAFAFRVTALVTEHRLRLALVRLMPPTSLAQLGMPW